MKRNKIYFVFKGDESHKGTGFAGQIIYRLLKQTAKEYRQGGTYKSLFSSIGILAHFPIGSLFLKTGYDFDLVS